MSTRSEAACRRREAHALRQEGKTQQQIAAALGVSQKSVSQYLAGPPEIARQRKERPPLRILRPATRQRIEQAQRLKAEGMPQHEIARQMGVTRACVCIWLMLDRKGAPPA